MDGIWTGGDAQENLRQAAFTRHKPLVVNTGVYNAVTNNNPWNVQDASGYASMNPNLIAPGTVNPLSPRQGAEGGPHYIMSGNTSDGVHTFGFEVCFFTLNLVTPALPASGGYNVTVWALISNTQNPVSTATPIWAAFQTRTGVNAFELYNSFDINVEAIRFQFGNLAADPTTNVKSIGILFAEL